MRDDPITEMDLAACLEKEAANFVCENMAIEDSTEFWTAVFHRMYGSGPSGNDDPRWNTLMFELKGRRILRKLQGRPSQKDLVRDA